MKFSHSSICLVVLALGCSSVSRKPASDTARLTITEQARPYVKTLPRAIYTFNYVPRAATGISADSPLNLSDPVVEAHLKGTLMAYWNDSATDGGDHDAPGLYMSDDPFSSRHFGRGADWLMFRIELPAGHRYLDLRAMQADDRDEIPDEMQRKLADAGCPGQDYYRYLFRKTQTPACRRIAYTTLRELGVDSFFYDWSWVRFAHCPHPSLAAMVLLNPALLQPGGVQGFSPRVPSPDPLFAERQVLEALRRDILSDDSVPGGQPTQDDMTPFWPTLPPGPPVDIGGWEKAHLLGCDAG